MAALDWLSGLQDWTPASLTTIKVGNIFPILMWAIVIIIAIFILRKFTSHRVWVEQLEVVKGGVVSRGGRYSISYDKSSKLKYMRPMFGSERLPDFPAECYQKVRGWPFVGIKREITLIFPNKHSPVALLPDNDIHKHSIKRWVFMNEKEMFVRKLNAMQFAYILSIAAPSVIILGGLIFFSLVVFYQTGTYQGIRDELNIMFDQLTALLTKGG